jgi:hypothetical protein
MTFPIVNFLPIESPKRTVARFQDLAQYVSQSWALVTLSCCVWQTTYWYVYQSGDQLKVKIGKSPAVQPDEGDEEDEEESVHSEYNRVRSQPRFSR